jgi:hypothetical protein
MSDDLDGSKAAKPTGEVSQGVLRPDFDRRVRPQLCGSVVTSDAGLLAYRELDDTLGLTDLASEHLAEARTGKWGRHIAKPNCELSASYSSGKYFAASSIPSQLDTQGLS